MAELLESGWFEAALVVVSLGVGAVLMALAFRVSQRFGEDAPESELEPRPDGLDASVAISLRGLNEWWRAVFGSGEAAGRAQTPFWLAIPAGAHMPFENAFESAGARVGLRGEEAFVVADQPESKVASWSFFARGAILSLSTPFIFTPGMEASPKDAWRRVGALLAQTRPERPLEGLLLTIDAAELMGPQAPGRELLRKRGAVLRKRLDGLQAAAGMVAPVYVVLTGLEASVGFEPYVRLVGERSEQIFGWSVPFRRDTAFEPGWIEDGLDTVSSELLASQLAHFAATGPIGQARDIVAMGHEVVGLHESLRALLTPVFASAVYGQSPMLRGIYFCGLTQGWGTRASRSMAFLDGLLEDKVFAEVGLAPLRPQAQKSRQRRRLVWQLLSGAVLAYTLAGFGWGQLVLDDRTDDLENSLGKVEELVTPESGDVDVAACFNEPSPRCLRQVEIESFAAMASIRAESLSTPLLPASWFDPIDERIVDLFEVVFDEVVIWGFRLQIHAELRNNGGPFAAGLDPGALWDLKRSGYGSELARRTQSVIALESPLASYAELADENPTKATQRLDATAKLYDFFVGNVPSNYTDDSDYYEEALGNLTIAPLDEPLTDWLVLTRADLAEAHRTVLKQAADADPLLAELKQVDAGWRLLAGGKINVVELGELRDAIEASERLLSGTDYLWLFTTAEGKGNPLDSQPEYVQRLELVRASELLGEELYDQYVDDGDETVDTLRRTLLGYRGGDRPSLHITDERGELSAELAEDIKPAIDDFLALEFVQRAPTDNLCGQIQPSTSKRWKPDRLRSAVTPYTAYQDYVDGPLAAVPADIRDTLQSLAGEALRLSLCDRLARAGSGSSSASASGSAAELADEFADELGPLSDLRQAFTDIGAAREAQVVTSVADAAAAGVLEAADREWAAQNPYSATGLGLASWAGDGTPAYSIFSRYSPEGIAEYLDDQREPLRALVREVVASPLTYLEERGEDLPPNYATMATHWRDREAAFDAYDTGTPKASLRVLENFVQNTMAVTTADECIASVPTQLSANSRDEFYDRANGLRRSLLRRCRQIVVSEAKTDYQDLRRTYTALVAGKFPFADAGAPAATPADVDALLLSYQQFRAKHQVVLSGAEGWRPSEEVQDFLDGMDRVVRFVGFDAVERIEDTELAMSVSFGSPEEGRCNLIEWSMSVDTEDGTQSVRFDAPSSDGLRWAVGRDLSVSARWAEDAPSQPSAAEGGTVDSDGAVHFEIDDEWALLRLFARYGTSKAGVYQTVVALPVNVERPADRAPSRCDDPIERLGVVDLSVDLVLYGASGEGRLTPPVFPKGAPKTLSGGWSS